MSAQPLMLSPHFTLGEFTRSYTAERMGIDNSLPTSLMPAAQATAALLERIRESLGGAPVRIGSGYRCLRLNRAVGSGDGSHHIWAQAVDFEVPAFGTPTQICHALAALVDNLGIGQLINEYPGRGGGGWVHVSTERPARAINRVITITTAGTRPGIHGS